MTWAKTSLVLAASVGCDGGAGPPVSVCALGKGVWGGGGVKVKTKTNLFIHFMVSLTGNKFLN